MHNASKQVLESLYFLVHALHRSRRVLTYPHSPRRDLMNNQVYSRDQNRRTCESSRDCDLYTVIIVQSRRVVKLYALHLVEIYIM